MKQKYIIVKGDKKTDLIIQEFAELEKRQYSFLMEGTYNLADIKKAADDGMEALMNAIKTNDLFPPHSITEKIAEAVPALLADKEKDSIEVAVDDAKILKEEEAALEEDLEPEKGIDELLKDDLPLEAADEEGDKKDDKDVE